MFLIDIVFVDEGLQAHERNDADRRRVYIWVFKTGTRSTAERSAHVSFLRFSFFGFSSSSLEYYAQSLDEDDLVKIRACLKFLEFGMSSTLITFKNKYYK